MTIKCGWASIDERGKVSGGKPGDQTGKEVKIGNWYNFGQDVVIRAKSAKVAAKMAKACKFLCRSDYPGYNQGQRTTLYDELEKVKFDYTKLKKKCNTDCSAYMGAVARCAGIKVSKNIWTGNMVAAFKATGKFEILTSAKYLTSDKYLKTGDIIVNQATHVIMALEDGSKAKGYAGTYPSLPTKGYICKGDKGTRVTNLQKFLKWYGVYSSKVDGIAGAGTDKAIREFQRKEYLTVDGAFGKSSLAKAKTYKA